MDGFIESPLAEVAPASAGAALRAAFLRDRLLRQVPPSVERNGAGILYAEDFDRLDAPEIPEAPRPEAAAEILPITAAQLEAAREAAYAAGLEAASRELAATSDQLRLAAMQALADALASARSDAETLARMSAEAAAATLLALLSAALPATMARHADLEAAAFASGLLPLLRHETALHLRAHPDRMPVLLEAASDAALKLVAEPDPAMSPTEFELRWADGQARTTPSEFWTTMRQFLAPLELPSLQELRDAE